MVLTNFELWAADGSSRSSIPLDFESNNPHTRHLNPFDPRVVPQLNSNLNHLSSNGYYGFSYVNAAHDTELSNNNNNNNISDINRNNNNNSTLIANDVNGMNDTFTTATQETHASAVNIGSSACVADLAVSVPRCKKRFFVMHDDVSDCTATNNTNYYSNNCEVSAKRCRFDDDLSAQYCNDFFQLPSTQIATQSCLMDTEEGLQPQQQNQQLQVDVAMFENNNNIIEKYEQKLNPQLQTLSTDHHQQHSQQLMQSTQLEQDETQQQHVFHQQQHYQDLQFATINCHLKHNNNCDTLALNNHSCKINLEKKFEKLLKNHKPNSNNREQGEYDKYETDVANKLKVDDAMLYAELHGGCLHHHDNYINSINTFSGDYIIKSDAMNHLKDDNYY